jgi:hypothetical protein
MEREDLNQSFPMIYMIHHSKLVLFKFALAKHGKLAPSAQSRH